MQITQYLQVAWLLDLPVCNWPIQTQRPTTVYNNMIYMSLMSPLYKLTLLASKVAKLWFSWLTVWIPWFPPEHSVYKAVKRNKNWFRNIYLLFVFIGQAYLDTTILSTVRSSEHACKYSYIQWIMRLSIAYVQYHARGVLLGMRTPSNQRSENVHRYLTSIKHR